MTLAHIGAFGALLLAACGKGDAKTAGPGGGGPPPMPVEVAAAREDTVVEAIQATGEVESIQSTDLRPDIEGRIVEILMREGAEVAEGQPLFRIDPLELEAEVARARAERDLAEQALARTRDLMDQNAASASDLERAEATARGARASLNLLELRLARTTVRAPFGGVLSQRFVSLGDYVTTSTRMVTIRTVDPMRVTFTVPERYAGDVNRGQRVTFQVAALPGEQFNGTVDFVSPAVQLPARTLLIKALVPNRNRHLQAGMFVEARLVTAVRPRAVVVPEEAILALQGNYFVWLAKDGKATRRQVTLGVRSPGVVELKQGVEPGDLVVVGGLELLGEGAPVNPTVVERGPPPRGEG